MKSLNAAVMCVCLAYAFYADMPTHYVFAIIFLFIAIGQFIAYFHRGHDA